MTCAWRRNGASREALMRHRVLSLDEYAAEIAHGSGQAAKLPVAERLRKFGTTITPIPVPLAPGESEAQYEARFSAWLAARGLTADDLRRHKDPNRERTMRCSYATYVTKSFVTNGIHPALVVSKDTEVEDGEEVEQESEEPTVPNVRNLPRDVLMTTKTVTLAEYREDIKSGKYTKFSVMRASDIQREYGVPIVPIMVPLAPGETLGDYEDRFRRWLSRAKRMTLEEVQIHRVPTLERYMRLEFASLNGKGEEQFVAPRTPPVKRTQENAAALSIAPAHKRARVEPPVHKEEAPTPKEEEPPMATSPARSKQQVSTASSTKDESQGSLSKAAPRANEVRQAKAISPVKVEAPAKAEAPKESSASCVGQPTVAACVACQCRKCLHNCMRLLAQEISAWEASRQCKCREDGSSPTDSVHSQAHDTSGNEDEDPIARDLQRAYDDINEMIVLNEKALEAEEARLLGEPHVADVYEKLKLQKENEELRELIQSEYAARSAAVVTLITYLWRNEPAALTQIVNPFKELAPCHVPHVQRRIHHRCADIARAIASRNAMPVATIDKATVAELKRVRRLQFALLVHFDESVRRGIRALLDMVTDSDKSL